MTSQEEQQQLQLKVQKCIDYWQNVQFDWTNLEKQGMEVLQNQRETALHRKRLADETKQFKTAILEDADKIQSEFPRLLKSYQVEIDSLSKRCKMGESAFLQLYALFNGGQGYVDPSNLISQLNSSVSSRLEHLESENQRLRDETAASNAALAELKESKQQEHSASDSELVGQNKRLQDRVKLLEKQLQIAEQKAAFQVPDISQLQNDIKFYKDREVDLLQQLSASEMKFKFFIDEQSRDVEIASNNGSSEEKAQLHAQLHQLEQEVQNFKLKSMQLEQELTSVRTDGEKAKLEREIGELRDSLGRSETVQEELKKRLEFSQLEINSHVEAIKQKEQEHKEIVQELNNRLDGLSDYETLKSELKVFKNLEFGQESPLLTVEAMAVKKTRRLEAQLVDLQLKLETANQQVGDTLKQLNEITGKHMEQTTLVQKLEGDLLKFNNSSEQLRSPPIVDSSDAPKSPESETPISADQKSLLQVITTQRDRFHQRMLELDSELKEAQNTISGLQIQISTLKDDNVRLYERVRYLTSFKPESSNSRTLDDVLVMKEKYEPMYETKLDPFAQFSKREQNRRLSRMPVEDRMALHISRIFLSNKYSRMFLVGYTLTLHLLVVGMMMYTMDSTPGGAHAVTYDGESLKRFIETEQNMDLIKTMGWSIKSIMGSSFSSTFCDDL